MTKLFMTTALFLAMFSINDASKAHCGGGPDYCKNDPRIASLLAAKKQRMSGEYPPRLIALLDKGSQCVARIRQSPDIFSFVFVTSEGNSTFPWSREDEDRAQAKLNSGELKRYWIINARRAFSCYGDPQYNDMDDYDRADDVNSSQALKCIKGRVC